MRCPAISRVSSSRIPPSDPNGVAILYPARSFFALLSEGLLWERRGREALTLTQHHREDRNLCLTAVMLHSHGPDLACDTRTLMKSLEKLRSFPQWQLPVPSQGEKNLQTTLLILLPSFPLSQEFSHHEFCISHTKLRNQVVNLMQHSKTTSQAEEESIMSQKKNIKKLAFVQSNL